MELPVLTLDNIANGAAAEVFEAALKEVVANINDVNTDPEAVRKLSLTFSFKPVGDRSGAEVTFTCKSNLVPVKSVKASVFFSSQGGQLRAFPSNARQGQLFPKKEKDTKIALLKDKP